MLKQSETQKKTKAVLDINSINVIETFNEQQQTSTCNTFYKKKNEKTRDSN